MEDRAPVPGSNPCRIRDNRDGVHTLPCARDADRAVARLGEPQPRKISGTALF